jgi:hypothetical protein
MLTKFELFLEGKWFGGGKAAKAGPNAPIVVPKPELPPPPPTPKKKEKEDDDIAKWIIGYLKKNGIDETKYQYNYNLSPKGFEPERVWKYSFLKVGKLLPEDPYGEEDWPGRAGNKEIRIKIDEHQYILDKWKTYFTIDVNEQRLEVSESLIKKIVALLDAPKEAKRKERDKRYAAVKKAKSDELRRNLFEKRSK